jgi:hypothetical protein
MLALVQGLPIFRKMVDDDKKKRIDYMNLELTTPNNGN